MSLHRRRLVVTFLVTEMPLPCSSRTAGTARTSEEKAVEPQFRGSGGQSQAALVRTVGQALLPVEVAQGRSWISIECLEDSGALMKCYSADGGHFAFGNLSTRVGRVTQQAGGLPSGKLAATVQGLPWEVSQMFDIDNLAVLEARRLSSQHLQVQVPLAGARKGAVPAPPGSSGSSADPALLFPPHVHLCPRFPLTGHCSFELGPTWSRVTSS